MSGEAVAGKCVSDTVSISVSSNNAGVTVSGEAVSVVAAVGVVGVVVVASSFIAFILLHEIFMC